jgi:hypothetical protein
MNLKMSPKMRQEDPGAELSGKYDFSAKRLEKSIFFLQNRRIK